MDAAEIEKLAATEAARSRTLRRRSLLCFAALILVLCMPFQFSERLRQYVLVPALLLVVVTAYGYLDRAGEHDSKAEALQKSIANRSAIANIVASERRFALYLRDYEPEHDRGTTHMMPGGTTYSEPDAPFEEDLSAKIGALLPIVCLLNVREPVRATGIETIYAADDQWLACVEEYARRATLILFCVDRLTANLWAEIKLLEEIDAGPRLFLSVTSSVHDEMLLSRSPLLEHANWVSVRGTRFGKRRTWNAGIPSALIRWLRGEPEPEPPPEFTTRELIR
jgi:hypothetical protein